MNRAMGELKDFAITAVRSWKLESEQLTAMWAKAHELEIHDATAGLLSDYLDQANLGLGDPNQAVCEGDQLFEWETATPLLPGFLNQGKINVLVAEQGTGKSNFCCGLFMSLVEGNGSFLDLEVPSSKNWSLYLIGPDMHNDDWGDSLETYGLIQNVSALGAKKKGSRHPNFKYLSTAGSRDSLSPESIERYREMGLKAVARGEHPLFVFDSYSSLVHAWKPSLKEKDEEFAGPLRLMMQRLMGVGITPIVLAHTPKSHGNVEQASSGTAVFSRIASVITLMERFNRNRTSNDKRICLTSGKRIESNGGLLIEQHYQEGRWESHGELSHYIQQREITQKIAKLSGAKAGIFELYEEAWSTNKVGRTKKQITDTKGIAYNTAKNHVNWLRDEGLLIAWGQLATAGTYSDVFYPAYAMEELRRLETPTNGLKTSVISTKSTAPQGVSPCEPLRTGVEAGAGVCSPLETPKEPLRTLRTLTNVYGQNVPSERQMVEDANGQNSMVITELVPKTAEVKVQEFGNASSPIKQRRWLVDVFPCGTHAKNNPVVFDDDEVL